MRFEVPQFIEIEDKIFGPLTWRQFLYLGGGVGMAVVIFLTTNLFVFILIGLPLGAIGIALAFVRINNRPFSYLLEAMFNYMLGQRMYLWRKKDSIVYRDHTAKSDQSPQLIRTGDKDISSMARRLELEAIQKDNQ